MGREVGNIFSHKGANVVLVARNSALLEKAVDYISVRTRGAQFVFKHATKWHVRKLRRTRSSNVSTGSALT